MKKDCHEKTNQPAAGFLPCALAQLRRGDRGGEAAALRQCSGGTGFVSVPGDGLEPQTAVFLPGYAPNGDYGDCPVCCHHYTTAEGDEHIKLCDRHTQLDRDHTPPRGEFSM